MRGAAVFLAFTVQDRYKVWHRPLVDLKKTIQSAMMGSLLVDLAKDIFRGAPELLNRESIRCHGLDAPWGEGFELKVTIMAAPA